jgi:Tfp pilus assembly protein PilV
MLRSRVVLVACALVPAGALAASTDQVHALRQEVAALQLDHALNLTQQQAQTLLPLLQDAQAKVQGLKAQRASSQPALVAALTQAVADLKANGTISDATLQALKAARGGSPGALRQDMASFWQQAKQLLTADQLQALRSVKLGSHPTTSNAAGNSTWRKEGHHLARHFRVMHTLLSDAFVALVQARAG